MSESKQWNKKKEIKYTEFRFNNDETLPHSLQRWTRQYCTCTVCDLIECCYFRFNVNDLNEMKWNERSRKFHWRKVVSGSEMFTIFIIFFYNEKEKQKERNVVSVWEFWVFHRCVIRNWCIFEMNFSSKIVLEKPSRMNKCLDHSFTCL